MLEEQPAPAGPADAPVGLPVAVTPHRERVAVAPCGDLDLATVDELRAVIEELVERGWHSIVLDLRGLTFMDSTGLSLCIRLSQRPDVLVEIVDGTGPVSRLFDTAGVRAFLSFVTPSGPTEGVDDRYRA